MHEERNNRCNAMTSQQSVQAYRVWDEEAVVICFFKALLILLQKWLRKKCKLGQALFVHFQKTLSIYTICDHPRIHHISTHLSIGGIVGICVCPCVYVKPCCIIFGPFADITNSSNIAEYTLYFLLGLSHTAPILHLWYLRSTSVIINV